jgi:hypothetical protein
MKQPPNLLAGAISGTSRALVNEPFATAAGKSDPVPSAHAWFAGGERFGYDPNTRTVVRAQGAPLNVFLRGEGDLAHAVSFLPGFPDGSFGWAKVLPHLPAAAQMAKLFVEPKAWSSRERARS